jgi:uncharacterized protein with GYD domain
MMSLFESTTEAAAQPSAEPTSVGLTSKSCLGSTTGGDPVAPFPRQIGRSTIFCQEEPMPTYIALLNWTPQGRQTLKQSPSRLDASRKAFEAADVKMKDFFMVTGKYDMVAVIEAADDLALAKAILTLTSQGNITSQTCRAFSESEYRQIIGGLA